MLILARHPGEKIMIGDGPDMVTITVIEVRSGRLVRLGVHAPASVRVDREETRLKKDLESGNGA